MNIYLLYIYIYILYLQLLTLFLSTCQAQQCIASACVRCDPGSWSIGSTAACASCLSPQIASCSSVTGLATAWYVLLSFPFPLFYSLCLSYNCWFDPFFFLLCAFFFITCSLLQLFNFSNFGILLAFFNFWNFETLKRFVVAAHRFFGSLVFLTTTKKKH